MPNCRTHTVAGAVAGGVWAGVTLGELPTAGFAVVVGGGLAGGAIGGMLPDLLEPAYSPRHRSFAHSWVALAAMTQARVNTWQRECHRRAEHYTAMAHEPVVTSALRQWYQLVALCYRFLAGALAGFKAGYVSHLVLDSITPCGLPLIGR